jgi:hypothetical protein
MLEVDKASESFWKSGLAMIRVTQFSGLVRLAWRALLGLASLPLIASRAGDARDRGTQMRRLMETPVCDSKIAGFATRDSALQARQYTV